MEVYEDIELEQEAFFVMVADTYTDYIVPLQKKKGNFLKSHRNSYEWEDVWAENIKYSPRIGVINSAKGDSVMLDCSLMSADYRSVISSSNRRHQARALICNKTNNIGREELHAGKYPFFAGKIEINNKDN